MKNQRGFSDWPRNGIKIVQRYFPDNFYTSSSSIDGKYQSRTQISSEQMLISFDCKHEVYTIWNLYIHKFLKDTRSMVTVRRGAPGDEAIKRGMKVNDIIKTFKPIRHGNREECVEIVVLVGKDALFEFCSNYSDYLFPHIGDNTLKKIAFSTPDVNELQFIDTSLPRLPELVTREIYTSYVKKRDPAFRKKILAYWDYTCIICGCREENILQAAHIRSVAAGGNDDIENGVCLCANHHLLFDSGLLEINFAREVFNCESETEKQMPWYLEAQKRNFKIWDMRNSNEK